MRDELAALTSWWREGDPVGLATVVGTYVSAPRPAGATMLVGPDGSAVGSVSGGCVEGAVYELAVEARDGGPAAMHRFGISDELAVSVGLTCGGIIDVFVERCDPITFPELPVLAAAIDAGEPVAMATVTAGPRMGYHLLVHGDRPGETRAATGSLGSQRVDDAVTDDALGLLRQGRSGMLRYGPEGQRRGEGLDVFVRSFAPRPRMIVCGAIDFAAAVASVGAFLDYRVTVCDARPVFATARRFPGVDEIVVEWPHRYLRRQADDGLLDERTAICVLTHDPKFDIPLLQLALTLPVGFVGAMGSRRTHDSRMTALREAGLTETQLSRLSSPIGLDLGARTPQETAISIAAEIVAQRWGGTGRPLTELAGAIHRNPLTDPTIEHAAG